MEILYQDPALWVAVKPAELLSEQSEKKDGFADLLAAENNGYVGVVHRLDRGVGGVMVYAKTKKAAAGLSACIQEKKMQKEYLAVVCGSPEEIRGEWSDLLFHDRFANKTYVVDRERKGVKEAILSYEVIKSLESEEYGRISLVRIALQTGRTHQIRVQFSHRGLPLLGDRKYGSRVGGEIALFSHRISFPHPISKKQLCFFKEPEGFPWSLFS